MGCRCTGRTSCRAKLIQTLEVDAALSTFEQRGEVKGLAFLNNFKSLNRLSIKDSTFGVSDISIEELSDGFLSSNQSLRNLEVRIVSPNDVSALLAHSQLEKLVGNLCLLSDFDKNRLAAIMKLELPSNFQTVPPSYWETDRGQ